MQSSRSGIGGSILTLDANGAAPVVVRQPVAGYDAAGKPYVEEEANAAKTRIMHAGGRQRVTGVTVNKVLGLSRCERRKLRAAVHHLARASRSSPRMSCVPKSPTSRC